MIVWGHFGGCAHSHNLAVQADPAQIYRPQAAAALSQEQSLAPPNRAANCVQGGSRGQGARGPGHPGVQGFQWVQGGAGNS